MYLQKWLLQATLSVQRASSSFCDEHSANTISLAVRNQAGIRQLEISQLGVKQLGVKQLGIGQLRLEEDL